PWRGQHGAEGVTVQLLPLPGVAAFGEGVFGPAFEAGQVFITGRECAGGDQDGAQVPGRLADWELIEGGVADCPLAGAEFAEDAGGRGLVQPCQHEVGPFAAGQGVVQAAQFGADVTAAAGRQDPEALRRVAAGAGGGAERRVPAGRAAFPEGRVGGGADRAQRGGEGAAADQLDLAAARALCPPFLAGLAPRAAGGLGDLAGRAAAADRAGHRGLLTGPGDAGPLGPQLPATGRGAAGRVGGAG